MRIKLIQSSQSEMVSYFHENLNKRIGAIAQTVYTDVYNRLRRRLLNAKVEIGLTFPVFYWSFIFACTDSSPTGSRGWKCKSFSCTFFKKNNPRYWTNSFYLAKSTVFSEWCPCSVCPNHKDSGKKRNLQFLLFFFVFIKYHLVINFTIF